MTHRTANATMDDNLSNNSSLNPNAASFQPWPFLPQPTVNNSYHQNYQINQVQNEPRNFYPNNYYAQDEQRNFYPNNCNVQNEQHENNDLFTYDYVPKLQTQIRAAVASLDNPNIPNIPNISNKQSFETIIDDQIINEKESNQSIIYYTTLTDKALKKSLLDIAFHHYCISSVTVPEPPTHMPQKANIKMLKSQTYQPITDVGHAYDVLNLLIIGYCHNIEGIKMHSIPNDLFFLFIKFYGYENENAKLIGYCGGNVGFGVFDYITEKTVYYIPKIVSHSMNTIICTVTNIKLPFHIINEYNTTNPQNEINEFNRFNVLFLQTAYGRELEYTYSAIVFNDNFALELIFPQYSVFNNFNIFKTKPGVYSQKYGFLLSINDELISFSLKAWKWTIIDANAKFTENGMCLLEKESKLFIYRWDRKINVSEFYFYDLNTSKFENVPWTANFLCPKPAFCCDETVNRRIYALSRNGKNAGKISYFDLDTFEWIHNALPKHRGMNQIWLSNDKNVLYSACNSIKRCIFMLDLKVGKEWKKMFSFRPFKESHCNTFVKL